MNDKVGGRDAIRGIGAGAVRHGFEGLKGAHAVAAETAFEQGIDVRQECRTTDHQDLLDGGFGKPGALCLCQHLVDTFFQGPVESPFGENAHEIFATQLGRGQGAGCQASLETTALLERFELEGFTVLEKQRLLHPAGFGEHQAAPHLPVGAVVIEEGVLALLAKIFDHPAVDQVSAHRSPGFCDHLCFSGVGLCGFQGYQRQVHGSAAHVDDQHLA